MIEIFPKYPQTFLVPTLKFSQNHICTFFLYMVDIFPLSMIYLPSISASILEEEGRIKANIKKHSTYTQNTNVPLISSSK